MRADYKICIGCHKAIAKFTYPCWTGEMAPFYQHRWSKFSYPTSKHHISARTFKNPPGISHYRKFRTGHKGVKRLRDQYFCECSKPFLRALQLPNNTDPRRLYVACRELDDKSIIEKKTRLDRIR